MQTNTSFNSQYFLCSLLTNHRAKKIGTMTTVLFNKTSQVVRSLAFLGFVFTSFTANALSVTADMSPEIIAEYEKQLALQNWPDTHTKLALMDNPYAAKYKALKKQLKAEAPEGKRKRLRTHEESIMTAKKMRFDYCQASVSFFVEFSQKAYDLSTTEQNPLTEEALMTGNGVAYPFTKAETDNPATRPAQIALTLGWKYKGKGKQYAEAFLASCLSIPVELYYKEDK